MAGVSAFGVEDAASLAATHALSFDRPWSATEFEGLMATPGVFALGDSDGFILCRAVIGEAEVLTLAVSPAARRGGRGRALLDAALAVATMAGADTAFLEVAEDNVAALALYSAAGFRQAGRRPGYYRRPEGAVDALIMRRPLNSGADAPYAGEA